MQCIVLLDEAPNLHCLSLIQTKNQVLTYTVGFDPQWTSRGSQWLSRLLITMETKYMHRYYAPSWIGKGFNLNSFFNLIQKTKISPLHMQSWTSSLSSVFGHLYDLQSHEWWHPHLYLQYKTTHFVFLK